ncbi:MAG: glutathione synthase [Alphaproteobacteria bacterium]|nr:glutathione synthase [Alphaproteobacteria bacterium]
MRLNVAIQMDPIEAIHIKGDSTFALALEAQSRGHRLYYYLPRELSLKYGRAFGLLRTLSVRDEEGNHFTAGEPRSTDLSEMEVVLMRQDPPFDMAYITATHILEHCHPATLVVNNPAQVRNAPEKLFVTRFPELMPATLISSDPIEIRSFRTRHKDIILKPLFGNGGAGVFRLKEDDENLGALLEQFTQLYREPIVVQAYLPEVRQGDKRIILVEGEPVGAINRVPPPGEARSNMHVGGRPEPSALTDRDRELCAAIGPELKARGLVFVGIDVIGGFLTEINVTSPTGIREVKRFGGADIAALVWDAIEERKAAQKS